jgi:hypothetical protein
MVAKWNASLLRARRNTAIREGKIDSFFKKDNPLFLSPITRIVLYNFAPIILSRAVPVNTEKLPFIKAADILIYSKS